MVTHGKFTHYQLGNDQVKATKKACCRSFTRWYVKNWNFGVTFHRLYGRLELQKNLNLSNNIFVNIWIWVCDACRRNSYINLTALISEIEYVDAWLLMLKSSKEKKDKA